MYIYHGRPNLSELKDEIRREVACIQARTVVERFVNHLQCVIPCGGGHLEHLEMHNKGFIAFSEKFCFLFLYILFDSKMAALLKGYFFFEFFFLDKKNPTKQFGCISSYTPKMKKIKITQLESILTDSLRKNAPSQVELFSNF